MNILLSLLAVINIIGGPASVGRYEKAEYALHVSGGSWSDAHDSAQAAVDLAFTAPDGSRGTLPCFYSGSDSTFVARFAPRQCGKYKLRFVYTEGGVLADCCDEVELLVTESGRDGFLHPRDNWTLQYENGKPFRGVGENLCWESRIEDDNPHLSELHQMADRFNYDKMLPRLAENGGNFTRMWMCSWNFPIDRKSDFNNPRYIDSDAAFNPSAAERLDHVIELADSLSIKIMLCMGQGDVEADADFFTKAEAKARYRNRLRYIVARWGYSSAIAMWEFFNEIDNIQYKDSDNPISSEDIVSWHSEMASYLRRTDPYDHIITTSISHRDLEGLNSIEGIDINQKHIYRSTSKIPQTILDYSEKFGKPYVIGEAGYEWDWYKNFEEIREGMETDFTRVMYYGLFNPTPVAPMNWWWEWFEEKGIDRKIRMVGELNARMLEAGGGEFESLEALTDGGEAYAVRCGETVFVYIFNFSDHPLTRLVVNMGKITIFRRPIDLQPNSDIIMIL